MDIKPQESNRLCPMLKIHSCDHSPFADWLIFSQESEWSTNPTLKIQDKCEKGEERVEGEHHHLLLISMGKFQLFFAAAAASADAECPEG